MARVQDVGLVVGALPAGPADAITDVPGVTVGHATLRTEELNTGVTAIRPHALLVTDDGAELLTHFPRSLEELTLGG